MCYQKITEGGFVMDLEKQLILVFGMERSGTTWIGKIFDSHPDVIYKHEPDSINKLSSIPLFFNGDHFQHEQALKLYINDLPDMNAPSICAKHPILDKNYLNVVTYNFIKLNALLSKVFKRYVKVDIPIFFNFRKHLPGRRLVWKSIESMSRFGVLSAIFKDSKKILIIRHPCGFVASVIKGKRSGHMTSVSDDYIDINFWKSRLTSEVSHEYNLTMEKILAMSQVEELSWRWLVDNNQALRDLRDDPNAYTIVYDELCENTEKEARKFFDFCQLSWIKPTINFLNLSITKNDEQYFSVFKNPSESANKWKNQLDVKDINIIKGITKSKDGASKFFEL
ncbi:MAG: hypothetical protein COA78_29900 [Blastopirellula sp.]|nr:MAG: hypothetical protein COA78_29900 [Blastopirellula sp.]